MEKKKITGNSVVKWGTLFGVVMFLALIVVPTLFRGDLVTVAIRDNWWIYGVVFLPGLILWFDKDEK